MKPTKEMMIKAVNVARKILFDDPERPMMRYVKRRFRGRQIVGAEAGVFRGRHACDILRFMPGVRMLYLVDPYDFAENAAYEREVLMGARLTAKHLVKRYPGRYRWFYTVFDSSIIPEPVDFIYIDGDHSYEAVLRDIYHAEKAVKPGGVVGGHDWGLRGVRMAVTEHYSSFKQKGNDWWVVN